MKKIVSLLLLLSMLLLSVPSAWAASAAYTHDPRYNSLAMEDVVYNPDAVYGFSPDPQSTRLGSYANFDWTDPALIEKSRQERLTYFEEMQALDTLRTQMEQEGKSIEEIARAVSAKRNEIRLASYQDNPEGLAAVKESNLKKYGNENGSTADSLFEKYGSWEIVLEKAFSSNPGMDACLGLYDDSFDLNQRLSKAPVGDTAIYVVKSGDCLSTISNRYFAEEKHWPAIYRANQDKIRNANLIYEGQQLTIPLP